CLFSCVPGNLAVAADLASGWEYILSAFVHSIGVCTLRQRLHYCIHLFISSNRVVMSQGEDHEQNYNPITNYTCTLNQHPGRSNQPTLTFPSSTTGYTNRSRIQSTARQIRSHHQQTGSHVELSRQRRTGQPVSRLPMQSHQLSAPTHPLAL